MNAEKKSVLFLVYAEQGKGIEKYCKTEIDAKETVKRWNTPKTYFLNQKSEVEVIYTYKCITV